MEDKQKQFIRDYLKFARWCLSAEDFSQEDFKEKLNSVAATMQQSLDSFELKDWQFDQFQNEKLIEHYLAQMSSSFNTQGNNRFLDDKRFSHAAWKEKPFFVTVLAIYKNIVDFHSSTPLSSELNFHRQRFIDAMAPVNSLYFNPEAMERALETDGESLLMGLTMAAEDIDRQTGVLKVRQVDKKLHKIGADIAVSDGSVIYENELIELILYPSAKTKSYSVPLLVVPPWINKFYILDLDENVSLVRNLTNSGFDVFLISWCNPQKNATDFRMDDYAQKGILAALDEIKRVSAQHQVNIVGYCIGGTLAASLYAVSNQQFKQGIKSLTLLTTLLDFEEAGDLRNLMNLESNPLAQQCLSENNGLPAALMGLSFQYLRPNSLIWPYIIRHYYLGEAAGSSAVMYWNSDGTQLSARVVKWLNENTYGANQLAKGTARLLDKRVNLDNLKAANTYCVATEKDHIAPWHAVFSSAQQFTPEARFILASSGHIKGIAHNPKTARGYKLLNLSLEREDAIKAAPHYDGSWWVDWVEWLERQSGELSMSNWRKELSVLRMAPGKYVLE